MTKVTFAVEEYFDSIDEIRPLLEAHWHEVGQDRTAVPMNVDWVEYAYLAAHGRLQVVVARSAGVLVGYHSAVVKPHIRYKSTLMGFVDVYYLAPAFRRGMTGVKLLKFAEEALRQRGCRKIFTATKLALDMGSLYVRMGYRPVETVYSKVLEPVYGGMEN